MDIPINATVECQNQECGKTTCLIINPIKKIVTHIVVRESGFVGIERLIPIEEILETRADHITLRSTLNEFSHFEAFSEIHYIASFEPFLDLDPDQYYMHPYLVPEFDETSQFIPVFEDIDSILPGELGIHRGATVTASDGNVGQVDEFLISIEDDKITHLVLREGHLWGKKDVTIPISEIDRIETDHVYLKLDKLAIEKLPTIPVKRYHP